VIDLQGKLLSVHLEHDGMQLGRAVADCLHNAFFGRY
jgi:hypothetical protein